MALSGKLTKKLVENLGPGRHGDGNGLYLVVDPSGARRWIVQVVVIRIRRLGTGILGECILGWHASMSVGSPRKSG